LPAQVTTGHPRGTRPNPLPLLPSGPDGVHGCPLRGTRLSLLPATSTGILLFSFSGSNHSRFWPLF